MTRKIALAGGLLAFALAFGSGSLRAQDETQAEAASGSADVSDYAFFKRYEVDGDAFDLRVSLEAALAQRGFLVSDVQTLVIPGITDASPPHLAGELVSFCGPPLTGAWLLGDLHSVVMCPVTIAIYVLPRESETVHISYRPPNANGGPVQVQYAAEDVDALLEEIIQEVAGL